MLVLQSGCNATFVQQLKSSFNDDCEQVHTRKESVEKNGFLSTYRAVLFHLELVNI